VRFPSGPWSECSRVAHPLRTPRRFISARRHVPGTPVAATHRRGARLSLATFISCPRYAGSLARTDSLRRRAVPLTQPSPTFVGRGLPTHVGHDGCLLCPRSSTGRAPGYEPGGCRFDSCRGRSSIHLRGEMDITRASEARIPGSIPGGDAQRCDSWASGFLHAEDRGGSIPSAAISACSLVVQALRSGRRRRRFESCRADG
jgi:hypothetical protein